MAVGQPAVVNSLGQIWGARIKERRRSFPMTQAQLAELCSVTQQTISRIEKGRAIPRDGLKARIAQKLGVANPEELFPWPDSAAIAETAAVA